MTHKKTECRYVVGLLPAWIEMFGKTPGHELSYHTTSEAAMAAMRRLQPFISKLWGIVIYDREKQSITHFQRGGDK